MLDLALKAIDRITRLLTVREHRMQLRFKEIYAPIYSDLEKVHADYLSSFVSARNSVSEATETTLKFVLLATSNKLRQQSVVLQPQRERLIAFAEIPGDIPELEAKFLKSVVDYFKLAYSGEGDALQILNLVPSREYSESELEKESYLTDLEERDGKLHLWGIIPGTTAGYSTVIRTLEEASEHLEEFSDIQLCRVYRHFKPTFAPALIKVLDGKAEAARVEWRSVSQLYRNLQQYLIDHSTGITK